MGGAVEMCSGLGACRKKLEGTMCPSYMATLEEAHSTRGRANVLRLAMNGRLGESGLGDEGVYRVLDLCLECRACKAECPVGVDVARFKSEFLADYWKRHGTPRHARMLGAAHEIARWGSKIGGRGEFRIGTLSSSSDKRAVLWHRPPSRPPAMEQATFRDLTADRNAPNPEVLIFNDTFTNYLQSGNRNRRYGSPRGRGSSGGDREQCMLRPSSHFQRICWRALRTVPARMCKILLPAAQAGKRIVFCEPSCLSAVREDAPSLLRGEEQHNAEIVARSCMLFEEFVELELAAGRINLSSPKRTSLSVSRPLPPEVDGPAPIAQGVIGSNT